MKSFPMDIYPVQLLKSILIEDIDMMEKIRNIVVEGFALCELVCTSRSNRKKSYVMVWYGKEGV
jgi:Na+-transporting NADH:ubiquinone oxidoreductase subunit A